MRIAVATPDIFLLHGLPGTGKSYVVAEILRQSTARGQRVLFLGSHTASLDVVLARLVDKPEVFALRLLEPGEKPEALCATTRASPPRSRRRHWSNVSPGAARSNSERAKPPVADTPSSNRCGPN